MNSAAPSPPATIRARIHESAVGRVTRIYAATLAEIFAEALQNSRRAGATRVRIAVSQSVSNSTETGDPQFTVTISDDGTGIADAAVLLSFGENGWPDALVRREDAAGFGFASLARRGCTVSSRPRSPDGETLPGWKVELVPEHFLGEADAKVCADETAPFPHGTSISFIATESAAAIRNAAENAARHYPLTVVFENRAEDESAGGEELPRRAFLDGAVHAEPWRGLAFGVFRERRRGYNDPDLNFFGLTLPVRLPTVETVHGPTWTVRADVHDCPDLELVLPARKEAVENAFLAEMREAARIAIYRAMAADPDPRPAFEDRARAHEAGIGIAPPPAMLRPWRPSVADVNDWREPGKLATADHDALVMACDPEPPEAQALWRAAERAGIAARLFEADRRLDGYGWYDALDRVTAMHVRIAADGDWMALQDYPLDHAVASNSARPRGGLAASFDFARNRTASYLDGVLVGARHKESSGSSAIANQGRIADECRSAVQCSMRSCRPDRDVRSVLGSIQAIRAGPRSSHPDCEPAQVEAAFTAARAPESKSCQSLRCTYRQHPSPPRPTIRREFFERKEFCVNEEAYRPPQPLPNHRCRTEHLAFSHGRKE